MAPMIEITPANGDLYFSDGNIVYAVLSKENLDRIHERNRELDAKVQRYENILRMKGINPDA